MDCTCLCLYVCVHKIYLFSSSLNLWIFLYELLIFSSSHVFSCMVFIHVCINVTLCVEARLQKSSSIALLPRASWGRVSPSNPELRGISSLTSHPSVGTPYLLFWRLQLQMSFLIFVWVLGMWTLVFLLAWQAL